MASASVARNNGSSTVEDIEYLYTERPQAVTCQLCNRSLDHLTLEERADHYAVHFAQDEERTTGSISGLSRNNANGRSINLTGGGASIPKGVGASLVSTTSNMVPKQRRPPPPDDVFWHPLLDKHPPRNFTPGLIPVLRRMLLKFYSKSNTSSRAVLCHEATTHIGGQNFDRMWGCGYRNFLMASTALVAQHQQQMYFPLLDGDPDCPPGVRNLQRWIEEAWSAGYDAVGAEQLKHHLYGTKKWIGTGEIYVAFTYKGIPACLVDFPKSKDTAAALLKWIVEYFSSPTPDATSPIPPAPGPALSAFDVLKSASQVTITSHMPLILQHKGHSRTIVGYEIAKGGATNLLIFDPAKPPKVDLRKAALDCHNRSRAKRRPSASAAPPSPTKAAPSPASGSGSGSAHPSHHHPLQSVRNTAHRLFHHLRPSKRARIEEEPIVLDDDDEDGENGAGPSAPRQPKRARGGSQEAEDNEEEDDEIVILENGAHHHHLNPEDTSKSGKVYSDDSTVWPEEQALDPGKVVNFFRVNLSRLSKHDEYQILYFPLSDPLTEYQKRQRAVVTSERIII